MRIEVINWFDNLKKGKELCENMLQFDFDSYSSEYILSGR